MHKTWVLWLACAALAGVIGCGGGNGGGDDDGGGTGDDGGGMDGSGSDDGGTATGDGSAPTDSPFRLTDGGAVDCGDGPCACDDGEDNDGDGLIDGMDPECTGPYDDDEGSFATGIPGDNIDFCQDCFFDGNSGMGDDGCGYHEDCLYTGEAPGTGGGDCFNCEVSSMCEDFCRPRTPNGCDCFGCCEVHLDDGSTTTVFLDADCSLDTIDDCPTCVQSEECVNECGECELCPGKTEEDLPDSCYDSPSDGGVPEDGGTPYTCDDGETVCETDADCGTDEYCQSGCCLDSII